MRSTSLAGLMMAGLLIGSATSASAQSTEVAYGMAPRADYVVFLEQDARLSAVAGDTVRMAAEAARSARSVQLIGRQDYADVVKDRLVRDGVPARSIVVVPRAARAMAPALGGVEDPTARRVEITF
ncbi:MAG: hypothetical protein U1E23_01390 [Reyranellaceae bacterium]